MSDRPVILCYDGSEYAALAIEHAGGLFPGRSAVVLVVWQSARAHISAAWPAVTVIPDYDVLNEAAQKAAAELALAGTAAAAAAGFSAEPVAARAHGPVWPAILSTADDYDAAAIVMGSRGLSGIKSMLLGGVSSGVVQHATRPVVVVPRGTAHLAAVAAWSLPSAGQELGEHVLATRLAQRDHDVAGAQRAGTIGQQDGVAAHDRRERGAARQVEC